MSAVPILSKPACDVSVDVIGYDGDLVLKCACGWRKEYPDHSWGRQVVRPADLMRDELEHLGPRRIGVRINANVKMSRGKATAQAIHAVLTLLRIHPESAVIVLGGNPADITPMPAVIRDAGRTELAPGTLTAGATWLGPTERMERE